MTKTTLLLTLILVVSGCSNDSYENYIGDWERQETKGYFEVAKIYKDGDTILIVDNILKNKKTIVLKKTDGQLSIVSGFGGAVLGLSSDNMTLRIGNKSYKKIDNKRLIDINKKISNKKKNNENCNNLLAIFRSERKEISNEFKKNGYKYRANKQNIEDFNKKTNELKSKYLSKEKDIPNCREITRWSMF